VRLVAVYPNRSETDADIALHATDAGFSFPITRDPGLRAATRFGAPVTPYVVVLDRQGRVRYRGRIDNDKNPAFADQPYLARALDALLTEQPLPKLPVQATRLMGCFIEGRTSSTAPSTTANPDAHPLKSPRP
jgi:hypothetical protein